MNLNIGIIGTNFISSDFCEAAASVPEAELYAVYSRKQETGDRFAKKHGIPRVYTDYDAFLDSGLNAVYVASPNFVHCEQTLKALRRGKHVLCEKVMAVNETQVQSMINCARENGLILLEAMRRAVEEAFPSRRVRAVRRARFRHFVLPDSDLLCRMEPEDRGDALPSEVRCRLLHGDACLAEAVFSLE